MLALATFLLGGLIGFFTCAALVLAKAADEAADNAARQLADGDGASFPGGDHHNTGTAALSQNAVHSGDVAKG